MCNNCYFNMAINGKPENIKKFLKLFICSDEEGKKRKPYLARTFLDSYKNYKYLISEKKDEIKAEEVYLMGWCAWSCWSCWFEGYPQQNKTPTLKEACKKCKVKVKADSEEDGLCFEEVIEFDGKDISYESKDMPEWICKGCKETSRFSSHYDKTDMQEQYCYNCDKECGWRKAK